MSQFKVEGLTIAVTNMTAMVDFYSNVFGVQFDELPKYDTILFSGKWCDINLVFCPAELANNTAKQNRHQFDIIVNNLEQVLSSALKFKGKQMGTVTKTEEALSVGIYDPDNNSIVLRQLNK